MEPTKTSQIDTSLTARQRAEQYGIDVSLIDINLQKTPYERICQHDRALNLALQLRQAMENRHD